MVLCYVDDVLAISATPMKTIEGIKAVFHLKGDKADVPDMYLGASIQKFETGWSPQVGNIVSQNRYHDGS